MIKGKTTNQTQCQLLSDLQSENFMASTFSPENLSDQVSPGLSRHYAYDSTKLGLRLMRCLQSSPSFNAKEDENSSSLSKNKDHSWYGYNEALKWLIISLASTRTRWQSSATERHSNSRSHMLLLMQSPSLSCPCTGWQPLLLAGWWHLSYILILQIRRSYWWGISLKSWL